MPAAHKVGAVGSAVVRVEVSAAEAEPVAAKAGADSAVGAAKGVVNVVAAGPAAGRVAAVSAAAPVVARAAVVVPAADRVAADRAVATAAVEGNDHDPAAQRLHLA